MMMMVQWTETCRRIWNIWLPIYVVLLTGEITVLLCTVLLPPGANPIAVNKYIDINININKMATSELPAHKKRIHPIKSMYLGWQSDLNSNLQILSQNNNTL